MGLPFGSVDSRLRLLRSGLATAGQRSTVHDAFDESVRWQAAKAGRYRLSRKLPPVTCPPRLNTPSYTWPDPLAFLVRRDILSMGNFVPTRSMERPQNQLLKALTRVMARCN